MIYCKKLWILATKSNKYYHYLLVIFLTFQSNLFSQTFTYLHWEEEKNPWTAEILKVFDPVNAKYPYFFFKHSRWGKSHTTANIDYISDDGREWEAVIEIGQIESTDSIIKPRFYHFWRNHANSGRLDTLMLVKADNNKVYRIELQKMTIQDYRSRTVPINVKVTLLSPGNSGGGRTNNPPQWREESRTICLGTPIPLGWVIQTREPCFSCNSTPGSACLQSVIVNLNGAPAGYEKWVCPGSTLPPGWAIVEQQPCVGACGDQAGTACVQKKIKNLSTMPSGSQVAVCPGSPVPAGWRQVGTQYCGGLCSDRAGQSCIMIVYRK